MDHRGLNILPFKKSTTLIELIIAIALMSIVILTLSSLDLFGRYHVLTAERTAKLQHEVSYTLEHMAKEISKAIGSVNQFPVTITTVSTDPAIKIWIDFNQNGIRNSYPDDRQIAYRFTSVTAGPPSTRTQIWYYAHCDGLNCTPPNTIGPEVISRRISTVGWTFAASPRDNFVRVDITACWDPDENPNLCGSPDNPRVTMSNRINMPSVSAN